MSENFQSENISGFTSESLFKVLPLFSVEPNALRVHLYTDELELCNPLGGNNKKHKICVVYFQVGNIGPRYLSSLQSIHLALVVKWNLVLKFGYGVVLNPLIRDMQALRSRGIVVNIRGGGSHHFFWSSCSCVWR